MRHHIGQGLLLFSITLALLSCKKKSDDTNGGGNGGNGGGGGGGTSSFAITTSSPEYLYWGDELTINGSGFSTNKTDYSIKFLNESISCTMSGFEVVNATSTQLKLKMPVGTATNGKKCGPISDQVIVTINGKSDTTDGIKFFGWPRIEGVCTHFGGVAGTYLYPGDSTSMNLAGAFGLWATVNNNNTNAALTVDGMNIPITWRTYPGCTNSLSAVITLDKEVFGVLKCPTDADWGGGGRNLLFKVSNPGTNRFDTMSIFVYWQPRQGFDQAIGPVTVSASAGGFPTWTITGTNMTYQKARFTSTDCMLTPQEVDISHSGKFYNQGTFPIPLSILNVGCNYSISIISPCGQGKVVGSVRINQ